MKKKKINDRIIEALNGRTSAPYHDLMNAVFPRDQFPRAYNHQANGGPPGCAMAFNKALTSMGGGWTGMGSSRTAFVSSNFIEKRKPQCLAGGR